MKATYCKGMAIGLFILSSLFFHQMNLRDLDLALYNDEIINEKEDEIHSMLRKDFDAHKTGIENLNNRMNTMKSKQHDLRDALNDIEGKLENKLGEKIDAGVSEIRANLRNSIDQHEILNKMVNDLENNFENELTSTLERATAAMLHSDQDQSKERERISNKAMPTENINPNPLNPDKDGIYHGFLSKQHPDYFRRLQQEIDDMDNEVRCQRYGWTYNPERPKNRRLFLGASIADEPWELFEIVGAETYNIFAGIVFVESNRTQNFTPRKFLRLNHTQTFQRIYGTKNVQVRPYINEDKNFEGLRRENWQRNDILKGWKEIGMQREDVGVLTDADETFTRDFYRAVQVCDIDNLDYEKGHCKYDVSGIRGRTQVFEGSPECIAEERIWYHPDMKLGHCIEEIGDERLHPKAPRQEGGGDDLRADGYGGMDSSKHLDAIQDNRHPLSNGADFRHFGSIAMDKVNTEKFPSYSQYTAFHFHNFFSNSDAIRFKYKNYGHPKDNAYGAPLSDLDADLMLMVHCGRNESDRDDTGPFHNHRIEGGFNATKPFQPIYFHDADYRDRRHKVVRDIVTSGIE